MGTAGSSLRSRHRRGSAWLFTVRLALSTVAQHPLRSFLSALAVSVGVAGLVAAHAVLGGLDRAVTSMIPLARVGTVYLTHEPRTDLSDEQRPPPPRIVPSEVQVLRERVTRASAVLPFYADIFDRDAQEALMVGDHRVPEVELLGVSIDWPLLGQVPIRGRFFSEAEADNARPVTLVGVDVAAAMEERGLGIGSTITMGGYPLEVIGVLSVRGKSLWGVSLDSMLVMPMGTYTHMFGEVKSLTVGIIAKDPAGIGAVQQQVIGAMRAVRKLRPDEPNNFNADPAAEGRELFDKLGLALKAVATALALFSVLISGGGILNIMLISVTERTREIGLRGALGVRPSLILAQFLVEGAAVSGTGALAGLLLGSTIAWGIGALTPLPARVTVAGLLLGLAFGLFVGMLFAFLPALRASRLRPAEALRS